jgi:hypothetical protein
MAKLPAAALDAVVAGVPASAPKGRVTPDFRAKLSWGGRYRCPAYSWSPASVKACVQEIVGAAMRGLIRRAAVAAVAYLGLLLFARPTIWVL